ncbi:hypothetical protein ACHWQZ_G013120 [Mnemiopsis leidyi]
MECLVIGCSGAGKSTLLNRLSSEESLPNVILPVLTPTVGSNVKDISFSKRKCIRLREVSGSLRQTWSQYLAESKTVIFLLDMTNRVQLSTGQVELLKLLSNPEIKDVPVLLLLNKTRSPVSLDISLVYNIFNLDLILKNSAAAVKVLEVDLSEQSSIENILSWIREKYNAK